MEMEKEMMSFLVNRSYALAVCFILSLSLLMVHQNVSAQTQTCNKLVVNASSSSKYSYSQSSSRYAFDSNLRTFWSAPNVGSWVQADLGASRNLCSVSIAWYRGNQRSSNFVISVSNDGASFTQVYAGKSSGTTNALEFYDFPDTQGRYVKVVVNGNSRNNSATINEIQINGFITSDTAAPIVSISSPGNGASYTSAQTVAINAAASDNIGVTRVEFYDGGALKATAMASPYSYNWTISRADNGTHYWVVKAYDAAGNFATTAATSVNVNIPKPDATAVSIGPKPIVTTDIAKGTLFASPNGSGTTCSLLAPCDIWTVVDKARGGDVVFLRGGTYPVSVNLTFDNVGSAAAPIIYESYPGESAVFDGIQHAKGTNIVIKVSGKFIALRNFEVKNMPMQGFWITGTDNVFDSLHVHHNGLSGIQVYSPYDDFPYNTFGSRNTIKNCVVHDNFDEGFISSAGFANGGNADGISISSGTDNSVENNLVYHNSDDGIDAWRSTNTYIGYNISTANGVADGNGNGIKAGGASPSKGTVVEHNLSYSNLSSGIDYNLCVAARFSNNTTWNNLRSYVLGSDTVASNNIGSEAARSGTGVATNNSWQRAGSLKFMSTDDKSAKFLMPESGGGFDDIGAFVVTTLP